MLINSELVTDLSIFNCSVFQIPNQRKVWSQCRLQPGPNKCADMTRMPKESTTRSSISALAQRMIRMASWSSTSVKATVSDIIPWHMMLSSSSRLTRRPPIASLTDWKRSMRNSCKNAETRRTRRDKRWSIRLMRTLCLLAWLTRSWIGKTKARIRTRIKTKRSQTKIRTRANKRTRTKETRASLRTSQKNTNRESLSWMNNSLKNPIKSRSCRRKKSLTSILKAWRI